MDIDRARLSQYAAVNIPALREREAERTDRTHLVTEVVKSNAGLLEIGHDADRSSRGAKALLLDVLA